MNFEVLLGFVEDGMQSTGKFHLLPMARLFELDQRMRNMNLMMSGNHEVLSS